MARFADYQRQMWTWLSYLTVCRFYIARDKHGNYLIKKSGRIRTFLYYLIWVNSLVKIGYLMLTYNGWLLHVGFLDQMSMWDWFLCFSQLVQESNMWYRKYPLYEVLHANWKVQEDVFRKLGSPEHVQQKILKNDKTLVYMHSTIVFVGCGALMIQFLTAPKYALNTYALLPFDNWVLRIFFAAHEYFYMFHIWVHQASSIVLCEVFSVTYTHLLNEMALVMTKLSKLGHLKQTELIEDNHLQTFDENSELSKLNTRSPKEHNLGRRPTRRGKFIPDRILDPKAVVPGTEYDIMTLLTDYQRIMLVTTRFNVWVGKKMAGTNMSNYGQFVSDVFMMIQLLKEPDTDFMGVFFYFEDACAGMIMLFRMLILMSRVYPKSEAFLEAFKTYLQQENPMRKYLLKYRRNLRIVASKIGGYSTNPRTVPKGINALMNYYIAAAMWQRPVDRRT